MYGYTYSYILNTIIIIIINYYYSSTIVTTITYNMHLILFVLKFAIIIFSEVFFNVSMNFNVHMYLYTKICIKFPKILSI